ELQDRAFADPRILENGKIEIDDPGAANTGEQRRNGPNIVRQLLARYPVKARGIKPALDGSRIRPERNLIRRARDNRVSETKRLAALIRKHALQLPPSR